MIGLGLGLSLGNPALANGGQVLRIAASLGRISGANANGGNDGTNTQNLSRTVHRTSQWAVNGIRPIVANARLLGVSPFGEAGVGNAVTYQGAIEFGGVNTYAAWAGVSSKSVADKTIEVADGVMDIAANQLFYYRNYLTVAAAANLWPRAQTVTQGSQYAKKGTNLLSQFQATGAVSGTPQDAANPPIAFIGYVDRRCVAVIYPGDSIADNTGDQTTIDPDGTVGFVGRGLVNVNGYNLPHAKLSRSGETLEAMVNATSGAIRRSLLQYATHYISQLGVNDLNAGKTYAQMTAMYLQEWADARAGGIQKIVRTTLTPQTTAPGNDFSTLVNQSYKTAFEPGGIRDQLNTWFATKLADGTIDYLVDVALDCSDPSDRNKWRVDLGAGNNTTDGTHPQSAIHTLMAARLNASAATWTAY